MDAKSHSPTLQPRQPQQQAPTEPEPGADSVLSPSKLACTRLDSTLPYQFITLSQTPPIRTNRRYDLVLRQQPEHSRVCGLGEKVDRRPVDPPPIIQMTIHSCDDDENALLYNPYYFVYASLMSATTDDERHLRDRYTRTTTGSIVSSLYRLRDTDEKEGAFFVFPDLSVRSEGEYRLKFTLYEIIGKDVYYCTSIISKPFSVHAAKRFTGMQVSTPLSRVFSKQGLKLRVRTEVRAKRQLSSKRRGNNSNGGSTDDNSRHDNVDNREKKRHRQANSDEDSDEDASSDGAALGRKHSSNQLGHASQNLPEIQNYDGSDTSSSYPRQPHSQRPELRYPKHEYSPRHMGHSPYPASHNQAHGQHSYPVTDPRSYYGYDRPQHSSHNSYSHQASGSMNQGGASLSPYSSHPHSAAYGGLYPPHPMYPYPPPNQGDGSSYVMRGNTGYAPLSQYHNSGPASGSSPTSGANAFPLKDSPHYRSTYPYPGGGTPGGLNDPQDRNNSNSWPDYPRGVSTTQSHLTVPSSASIAQPPAPASELRSFEMVPLSRPGPQSHTGRSSTPVNHLAPSISSGSPPPYIDDRASANNASHPYAYQYSGSYPYPPQPLSYPLSEHHMYRGPPPVLPRQQPPVHASQHSQQHPYAGYGHYSYTVPSSHLAAPRSNDYSPGPPLMSIQYPPHPAQPEYSQDRRGSLVNHANHSQYRASPLYQFPGNAGPNDDPSRGSATPLRYPSYPPSYLPHPVHSSQHSNQQMNPPSTSTHDAAFDSSPPTIDRSA
ncbi:hypothetical protein RTP6_003939 [Batrachochytrium dendrobatidis]